VKIKIISNLNPGQNIILFFTGFILLHGNIADFKSAELDRDD
jgi:hypothetical protein